MPRTNRMSEYFSKMTGVGVIRAVSAGGSTTVKTGGAPADVATCPVTAFATFVDTDPLIIGDAEQMEINKIEGTPADPMPLAYPLFRAHIAGEAVKEGVKTVLGDLTDEGAAAGFSGEFNPMKSATRRLVQGYVLGHLEGLVEFKLNSWNLENIAAALGISDVPSALTGPITGAGSAADPYRLVVDGSDMSTTPSIVQACYFTGALKGGGVVEIQAWGAEVDPTTFNLMYKTGAPAELPFKIRPVGGISFETY